MNIPKELSASIFSARSDQVGGSMFLCSIGVHDVHKLTLWDWPLMVHNNDL
jgi:hypothetical protein